MLSNDEIYEILLKSMIKTSGVIMMLTLTSSIWYFAQKQENLKNEQDSLNAKNIKKNKNQDEINELTSAFINLTDKIDTSEVSNTFNINENFYKIDKNNLDKLYNLDYSNVTKDNTDDSYKYKKLLDNFFK